MAKRKCRQNRGKMIKEGQGTGRGNGYKPWYIGIYMQKTLSKPWIMNRMRGNYSGLFQ